jgi:hypothetical protein
MSVQTLSVYRKSLTFMLYVIVLTYFNLKIFILFPLLVLRASVL